MNPLSILIVDDDLDASESLSELLREEEYSVSLASSGERAIEIYQPGIFDLVILDLKMPGMGGVKTLEILRQNDPEIQVVISTGNTFGDELDIVQQIGVKKVFYKPISPEMLLEFLQLFSAADK